MPRAQAAFAGAQRSAPMAIAATEFFAGSILVRMISSMVKCSKWNSCECSAEARECGSRGVLERAGFTKKGPELNSIKPVIIIGSLSSVWFGSQQLVAQGMSMGELASVVPIIDGSPLTFRPDFGAMPGSLSVEAAADVRLAAFPDAPAASEPAAEGDEATAIAKKLQNPVADLISVPIQWNLNTGVGPHNDNQNIINIQPVIPFQVSDDLNIITRTIVPIINTPVPDWETGLGDIQFSTFFSPAKPSKVIWGVGPIFQFPTATDDALGTGKWSAGPTAVGLYMEGPWVIGALANQLWSFAGDSKRAPVNQFLVQPFVNYNFGHGTYVSFSPIITANWDASADNAWVVPVGIGIGQVFKIGDQILNAQIAPYYNVVTPDNGPEWTIRFQLTFVFPTK